MMTLLSQGPAYLQKSIGPRSERRTHRPTRPVVLGLRRISNGVPSGSILPRASPMGSVSQEIEQNRVSARRANGASNIRFNTRQGSSVTFTIQPEADIISVTISISGYGAPLVTAPCLHWGMHRASLIKWYHPKEVVPQGSILDSATGGMRSPTLWDTHTSSYILKLQVPAKLAPVNLSMAIYHPGKVSYEEPRLGQHMCVPLGMSAGSPGILGASLVGAGKQSADGVRTYSVNFAVFSRNAKALSLILVRAKQEVDGSFSRQSDASSSEASSPLVGGGYLEVALDPITNKTGDCWHVCIDNMKNIGSMCYGWRAEGAQGDDNYHPGYVLLDPYATRTSLVTLPEAYWNAAPSLPPYMNMQAPVLMGSLFSLTDAFDWQGAHRPMLSLDGQSNVEVTRRSLDEAVYVDLDVGSFSQDDSVPVERQGKLLGILDRLPVLVESGATCVILNMVCTCGTSSSKKGVQAPRRAPLGLFAPDPSLAVASNLGPLGAANQLKQVIRAIHSAGLEVMLAMEFCITAEAANPATGGLQGLSGLDHALYYRPSSSGLNVLKTGHPIVRRLVLDCLRHWADEYHVDGFCLLNAENLAQDQFGAIMDNPPLAEEIAHDPVLRHLKLVAAPGDVGLLPRGGHRGFPHWGIWAQWNNRYINDMSSYLASGAEGMLSTVATRLTGSPDLLSGQWDAGLPGGLAIARRPCFGLNAVLPPGDTPLITSLAHQMNADAPEMEMVTAQVIAKSMLLAQFVSSGVPCFTASTIGTCPDMARFISLLAVVRRSYHDLLAPVYFDSPRSIRWYSAGASGVDWSVSSSKFIAFTVTASNRSVYVAFNPSSASVTVTLPPPPEGCGAWRKVVDTAAPSPDDATLDGPVAAGWAQLPLWPRGALMLIAVLGQAS